MSFPLLVVSQVLPRRASARGARAESWWGPHPPAGPTITEARGRGAPGDMGCSPHFPVGVNPETRSPDGAHGGMRVRVGVTPGPRWF
ncbi:hypothetical protein GCM10010488_11230 [Oerskovia jenensis]